MTTEDNTEKELHEIFDKLKLDELLLEVWKTSGAFKQMKEAQERFAITMGEIKTRRFDLINRHHEADIPFEKYSPKPVDTKQAIDFLKTTLAEELDEVSLDLL